jgi:hypothetical protein
MWALLRPPIRRSQVMQAITTIGLDIASRSFRFTVPEGFGIPLENQLGRDRQVVPLRPYLKVK